MKELTLSKASIDFIYGISSPLLVTYAQTMPDTTRNLPGQTHLVSLINTAAFSPVLEGSPALLHLPEQLLADPFAALLANPNILVKIKQTVKLTA